MSGEDQTAFIESAYLQTVLLGLDPSGMEVNYDLPDTDGDDDITISVAWPDSKVGIALEFDDIELIQEQGWYVVVMTTQELQRFHQTMAKFLALSREQKLRSFANTEKTTSQHETWLLQEIIRRNLPSPDRNFKFFKENGKELTVPDFTWDEEKIAFFVDGLWWHISMDDKEKLEAFSDQENHATIINNQKTRAERDASNRSQLAARGWIVLNCTDRDLETAEGIRKQGELIENAIKNRRREMKAVQDMISRTTGNDAGLEDKSPIKDQTEPEHHKSPAATREPIDLGDLI